MASAAILRAARARIADPIHWVQGTYATNETGQTVYARDPSAACWCAYGALRLAGMRRDSGEADALRRAAEREFGSPHPEWVNDELGHAAVLRMYDVAIALVEGEA